MRGQKIKQEELYQYVTSERFYRRFEKMLDVQNKRYDIQTKEEKNHKSLWSSRRQLDDDFIDAYYDISSELERITQKPQDDDLSIADNQIADESNGNGKATHHHDFS